MVEPERNVKFVALYEPARVVEPEKEMEESEPVNIAFQSPPVPRILVDPELIIVAVP